MYSVTQHSNISSLLSQLGITPNYMGYYQLTRCIELLLEKPEGLQCVQKELYLEIAAQYHVDWKTVERNIRTVVNLAWRKNSNTLSQMSVFPLARKPSNIEFFVLLITWLNANVTSL